MWSTTIIFLRLLGTTEHPIKTVFYFMLVSFIVTSFAATCAAPKTLNDMAMAIIVDNRTFLIVAHPL